MLLQPVLYVMREAVIVALSSLLLLVLLGIVLVDGADMAARAFAWRGRNGGGER